MSFLLGRFAGETLEVGFNGLAIGGIEILGIEAADGLVAFVVGDGGGEQEAEVIDGGADIRSHDDIVKIVRAAEGVDDGVGVVGGFGRVDYRVGKLSAEDEFSGAHFCGGAGAAGGAAGTFAVAGTSGTGSRTFA